MSNTVRSLLARFPFLAPLFDDRGHGTPPGLLAEEKIRELEIEEGVYERGREGQYVNVDRNNGFVAYFLHNGGLVRIGDEERVRTVIGRRQHTEHVVEVMLTRSMKRGTLVRIRIFEVKETRMRQGEARRAARSNTGRRHSVSA